MGVGQSFRELLATLVRHDVEFLVVGATAAVLEGAPLTTFDLDVVFEPSAENRAHLLRALVEIDATYLDPLRRGIRPTEERLTAHRMNLLETRLGRLDVMTSIAPGWNWGDLVPRSHTLEAGGMTLRVLDLEAVIESKLAAGEDVGAEADGVDRGAHGAGVGEPRATGPGVMVRRDSGKPRATGAEGEGRDVGAGPASPREDGLVIPCAVPVSLSGPRPATAARGPAAEPPRREGR